MRRLRALSSLTRPAWLVSHIWVIIPGPSSTGVSSALPGGSRVMSRLASFHFGCSLLEIRRFRPTGGVASAPSGSRQSGEGAAGGVRTGGRGAQADRERGGEGKRGEL